MSGEPTASAPAASVTFLCYADGRVSADIWAGTVPGDKAARNAGAIERLVRLTMTAPESVRMKIEAALYEAEHQAGRDAQ